MPSHVQVVLKDEVENLGKSGELVRVRPGYARNYLIPRGLAAPATRANVAEVEHAKKVATTRAAKQKGDAEALSKQLSGLSLELAVAAGEGDKLFGSIGTKDIAEALEAKGQKIDRKKIVLADNIKTLGEHTFTVKLGQDVTSTVKLNVVRKA